MPPASSWQDVLDPPFVQRLLRPWQYPGRIDPRMTRAIFDRYQPMTVLPLVDRLTQRQHRIASQQSAQPIVYAQPPREESPSVSQPIAPAQSSGLSTVIQAKFISSSPTITQPSAKSLAVQSESESKSESKKPLENSLEKQPNLSSSIASANFVEQSPFSHPPELPDLPLILPTNPSASTANSPMHRPRRPRFERDIGRAFSHLEVDLHAEPSPDSATPSIPVLPLASLPDPSFSEVAQPFNAIVTARRSALQNESSHQSLPLVSIGSVPLKEKENSPKLPVIRSPHRMRKGNSSPTGTSSEQPTSPPLPLVQVLPAIVPGQSVPPAGTAQPLVFSAPTASTAAGTGANHFSDPRNSTLARPTDRGNPAANPGRSTGTIAPPAQSIPIVSPQPQAAQPPIDVDALADKVERKLMRRFVVERERRGFN